MPGSAQITRTAVTQTARRLLERLDALGAEVRAGEQARLAGWRSRLRGSAYAGGAANLAANLAFRQHDIREIQDELGVLGLSSLGRTEAHVRAGIAAVSAALGAVLGDDSSLASAARIGGLCAAQDRLLAASASVLLGPEPADRRTRVMVTLRSEAAGDAGLIGDLVGRGMDIARINGAHDGPEVWRAMADLVRSAARDAGRGTSTQEQACPGAGEALSFLRTANVRSGPRTGLGDRNVGHLGELTPRARRRPKSGGRVSASRGAPSGIGEGPRLAGAGTRHDTPSCARRGPQTDW